VSALHGELEVMFPGRKLKTYQVSVVTFWVMVLMLLGRKLKKTYLLSVVTFWVGEEMLNGRKLIKKTYLLLVVTFWVGEEMLNGKKLINDFLDLSFILIFGIFSNYKNYFFKTFEKLQI